ncbi:unnamed protein product [Pleuronectes platessa]|uniref:Uncharacterized protein n=1 Tax=Pleuronectes platessa TaxID=8262 RepID=A0A9N7YBD2_PLEPL|nr:unnamed protein product [Pleuronectes platessa]
MTVRDSGTSGSEKKGMLRQQKKRGIEIKKDVEEPDAAVAAAAGDQLVRLHTDTHRQRPLGPWPYWGWVGGVTEPLKILSLSLGTSIHHLRYDVTFLTSRPAPPLSSSSPSPPSSTHRSCVRSLFFNPPRFLAPSAEDQRNYILVQSDTFQGPMRRGGAAV